MPTTLYCWRCKTDVPMLSEDEWNRVNPEGYIEQVQRYRKEHGATLKEALAVGLGKETLDAYGSLTGFKETNLDALFHHRLKLYGTPCVKCGKPLRTPVAQSCAACGASAP